MSLASREEPFDFALISRRTGDFTDDKAAAAQTAGDDDPDLEPARA